jgi:hypothetical protein
MTKLPYPKPGVNTPQAKAQREAYWRDIVRRWKASGLSKWDYCRGKKFTSAALHYWIKEIQRRDSSRVRPGPMPTPKPAVSTPASFVPVRVVGASQPVPEPIEILVGSHAVRVRPGFDPEALREVVRALEVQPC